MLRSIFHLSNPTSTGSNAERTAISNRQLVLKALTKTPLISRSELASVCHLRKQTLTNIIKELLELDLIMESGKKIEGKGQPKTLLDLNPDAVISIGVHMDQNYLKVVSMNWRGSLRLSYNDRICDRTPKTSIDHMEKIVKGFIEQEKLHCRIIAGVGISLPNLVDNDIKNYQGSQGWEAWVDYPLEQELSEKIDYPIYIENDATACAFGHNHTKKFKDLSNFITLFIGHGLGSGIIHNQMPMRGNWGNAGEIGRIKGPHQRLIEDTLSITGLKKTLNIQANDIPASLMLIEKLNGQDADLDRWINAAAQDLTFAVNIIENIFDPETIILSGYLPSELLDALIQRTMPLDDSISNRFGRKFERITRGYVQEGITAKGAAFLPLLLL